jgi:hypothetical protein
MTEKQDKQVKLTLPNKAEVKAQVETKVVTNSVKEEKTLPASMTKEASIMAAKKDIKLPETAETGETKVEVPEEVKEVVKAANTILSTYEGFVKDLMTGEFRAFKVEVYDGRIRLFEEGKAVVGFDTLKNYMQRFGERYYPDKTKDRFRCIPDKIMDLGVSRQRDYDKNEDVLFIDMRGK